MSRKGMKLTAEAEADRDDFKRYEREYGDCSCHISPPCGSCTHPGNPLNQDEDDSCWEPEEITTMDKHSVNRYEPEVLCRDRYERAEMEAVEDGEWVSFDGFAAVCDKLEIANILRDNGWLRAEMMEEENSRLRALLSERTAVIAQRNGECVRLHAEIDRMNAERDAKDAKQQAEQDSVRVPRELLERAVDQWAFTGTLASYPRAQAAYNELRALLGGDA